MENFWRIFPRYGKSEIGGFEAEEALEDGAGGGIGGFEAGEAEAGAEKAGTDVVGGVGSVVKHAETEVRGKGEIQGGVGWRGLAGKVPVQGGQIGAGFHFNAGEVVMDQRREGVVSVQKRSADGDGLLVVEGGDPVQERKNR